MTTTRIFRGPPIEHQPGIGALTLPGFLEEVAERHGPREAVVFHGPDGVVRWTYDDLLRESRRVARALLAHGVVKGTRVAVLMGNRPEFVSSVFGAAMAGAVVVPVSTFITAPELDHVLRHSDAALLLAQDRLLSHAYLDALVELCPEVLDAAPGRLRSPRFPFLRHVAALGVGEPRGAIVPMDAFLGAGDDIASELVDACVREIAPSDDAVVIYTSGTTAQPKGVLHAHRAPTLQGWRLAQELRLDAGSRVWTAFPFFWTSGLAMIIDGTLAAGACLVLQEHFDAGEALRLFEVERVTTPLAKAHQFSEFEDHPDWATRDLSSLRDVDPLTSLVRHPSVKVDGTWSNRAGYGLTETMSHLSSTPVDAPAEERQGHFGSILAGNAVVIRDPVTGEAQGPDLEGEITVKGLTLTKGYLKTAPEDVFDADGFFRTGDSGFVDDRNRLHFTGRTNDLIKTGGANVAPLEVEHELLAHPGVHTVWVVGIPDEARGELVVACVVPHDGVPIDEDGVRQFLRGRIASYKIPRHVVFIATDDLVMTSNNAKPRVDALRALVEHRLTEAPSPRGPDERPSTSEHRSQS